MTVSPSGNSHFKDNFGLVVQAINIHTNIHHITQQNNYIVTVSGVGDRKDFYQQTIQPDINNTLLTSRLSKRELEVFILLIKGYTDKEIAKKLFISYHTVRTHHKHILGKTKSKNSKVN